MTRGPDARHDGARRRRACAFYANVAETFSTLPARRRVWIFAPLWNATQSLFGRTLVFRGGPMKYMRAREYGIYVRKNKYTPSISTYIKLYSTRTSAFRVFVLRTDRTGTRSCLKS